MKSKLLATLGCTALLSLPAAALAQSNPQQGSDSMMGSETSRSGSSQTMGQDASRSLGSGQQQQGQDVSLSKSQIESMQRALTEVQPDLAVDGIFGPNTRQALQKYQRENNLEATGRPNQETLASLGIQSEGR